VWGSGKSASADGTKWDLYPQNLMSEYHIRYGGYGSIACYLVADYIINLFFRSAKADVSDFVVDQALTELARFSLVRLTSENVSMHRLLQVVEQDSVSGNCTSPEKTDT
jgi:hypothetical protein